MPHLIGKGTADAQLAVRAELDGASGGKHLVPFPADSPPKKETVSTGCSLTIRRHWLDRWALRLYGDLKKINSAGWTGAMPTTRIRRPRPQQAIDISQAALPVELATFSNAGALSVRFTCGGNAIWQPVKAGR